VVRNKWGRRIVLRSSRGRKAKLDPSALIAPKPRKLARRNAAKPRRPVRYKHGSPWFSGDLCTDYWRWIWHHELMGKDLKKRGKPIPDYLRPHINRPPKHHCRSVYVGSGGQSSLETQARRSRRLGQGKQVAVASPPHDRGSG
jgi:hypothetical protein